MNALAMLELDFMKRVNSAVEPPDILASRPDISDFIDALRRGWPDVAIVDPTLTRSSADVPIMLRKTHVGTVLYVRLTPAYAKSLVAFVRKAEATVVTFGYGDDPRSLAAVLFRSSRNARGRLLLDLLSPFLAELPKPIRDGLDDLNERCKRVDSVATLACYCSVGRSTLTRRLCSVGIKSAADLVMGLALVRNFDTLTNSNISLQSCARMLGMTSAKRLIRHCARLSGMTPNELRLQPPVEKFALRIAESLTSAMRG